MHVVAVAAAGITLMVVVWWLFLRLRGFLLLLLTALFVSLAIEPAVSWLARRGWRRGLSTSLIFIALIVLGLVFVGSIGAVVATQVRAMAAAVPHFVAQVTAFSNEHFHTHLSPHDVFGRLAGQGGPLRNLAPSLPGRALSYGATAFGLLFDVLTIGLFAFFFAADGPRLRRFICSLLPPAKQREVLRAWNLAVERTAGYLYSRGLLAVASAIASGIFFTLIHLPYGAALGIWVGVVSQFIPTVGTYLAAILPGLIALANDPLDILWIAIFMTVYQSIENYAFMPKLTAYTLSIHPAVAFGAVIVGAAILGPVGALLALPAAASIQGFASAYIRRYQVVDGPLTEEPKAVHRSDTT